VLLYPQTPPAAGLMAMFRGNGNGTFTFVNLNALVTTGVRPTQLWVEDFNGDGTDDVAVVNSQNAPTTMNGTVMVFFGNPANNDTFAQPTPNFTMTVQLGATDLVGGNFNGGPHDLVVSNYQSTCPPDSPSRARRTAARRAAASSTATSAPSPSAPRRRRPSWWRPTRAQPRR
jgi:hypothetical protein